MDLLCLIIHIKYWKNLSEELLPVPKALLIFSAKFIVFLPQKVNNYNGLLMDN